MPYLIEVWAELCNSISSFPLSVCLSPLGSQLVLSLFCFWFPSLCFPLTLGILISPEVSGIWIWTSPWNFRISLAEVELPGNLDKFGFEWHNLGNSFSVELSLNWDSGSGCEFMLDQIWTWFWKTYRDGKIRSRSNVLIPGFRCSCIWGSSFP